MRAKINAKTSQIHPFAQETTTISRHEMIEMLSRSEVAMDRDLATKVIMN